MKQLPPDTVVALVALRDRLLAAPHGTTGTLVSDAAAMHGVSVQTLYRWLSEHAGYAPKRKQRADAGASRLSSDVLDFVASAKRESTRGNGKVIMPTPVALNVADANGMPINVSASTVNRLLRQRRMDAASLSHARTTISMRTEYPNQVHQIDPSLCVLFYMGGKQQMMTEQRFNKNKPGAYARVKLKVWRYVRYDHASASIDVRYFEAAGENQQSLFEFLMWTWGKQDGRLSHGRPEMIYWDKGSANTSSAIVRLLDALDVKHETHATGHAWAKGGVENANNLVETHFESRLKIEPVESVAQLNAAAEKWVRDYNANVLAHIDSRVVRASGEPMVRDDLWSLIAHHPHALVELPPVDVCKWFLAGHEHSRQVRNNAITFAHPELGKSHTYDLSAWAQHIGNGMKVAVTPLLLQGGKVRCEVERIGQEPLVLVADALTDFNEFGQLASAPILGKEYGRSAKSGDEVQADRLAAVAYGKGTTAEDAEKSRETQVRPFAHADAPNATKGMVAHSHLGAVDQPTRLLPKADASVMDALQAQVQPTAARTLTHFEAARWLAAHDAKLDTAGLARLRSDYPHGVPEDALEPIARRTQVRSGLSVVAGGAR
ncbi:transposase [Limnohabitans sp.]|uniref:transposase n=1 Tax=Limnohabitans sp. TaxID=1907725 RepID=UPI00286F92F1|nr:transposase [Limnohabitans sp.]